MYYYFKKLGLFQKTGIDLPGEATSIMHKKENIKAVELATISFGQSFQITPLQLMVASSAVVNGGTLVTPHLGVEIRSADGTRIRELNYPTTDNAVTKETSETMKELLEAVVAGGTGRRAYLPGFRIGGKTATSEKLPRSSNKYISSFIGFAPANNPQVMAMVLIEDPVGIYYGGTIAAPVIADVFDNILPYLGIEESYTEAEKEKFNIGSFQMPNFIGKTKKEVKDMLKIYDFGELYSIGEGEFVKEQFPLEGETIDKDSDLILYFE
ncbi:MAG: putative rane protein [Firmicutes bacterium]|nr:putative rane protein [Bacillota bacterium]